MIYLGTDIIDIKRIRKNIALKKATFLNKIYTKQEIEYCKIKADPAMHFAGRFAGKEAVKKAVLSAGILNQISMKEIEILSLKNIPTVNINSVENHIIISISHTDDLAIATAIIIE